MPKYFVFDFYESPDHGKLIGASDTLEGARHICDTFLEDTDGECDIEIRTSADSRPYRG